MGYMHFPNYVMRVPTFSFSTYQSLTKEGIVTEDALRTLAMDAVLKEALFLASPVLYSEFEKWMKGDIEDAAASERLFFSVLKYMSRMTSRCTPFGLFAGVSVGSFGAQTAIELAAHTDHSRATRLDMNYLVALSLDLAKQKWIREQLVFYPNTSMYMVGKQWRYVEYTYVKSKRVHHVVGIEDDTYIQKVLKLAKEGATIAAMAEELVCDEISCEEASEYIHQLIDYQVLVSELEPSVSGAVFLEQLVAVLRPLKGTEQLVQHLMAIDKKLSEIDTTMGNDPMVYEGLRTYLEALETDFDPKFLFQTDMNITTRHNTIARSTLRSVYRAMRLLARITEVKDTSKLADFQKAFEARYEGREVPLAKVLDVESGIGFSQHQGDNDVSAIVDDLVLPLKKRATTSKTVTWWTIHTILQEKLQQLEDGGTVIRLEDTDVKDLEMNLGDLPDTIYTMLSMAVLEGKEQVVLSTFSGSSGANLLGRFCHGHTALHEHTAAIVAKEEALAPDVLVAEIAHLPEARVGNVLMRPRLRKYEIPYLATFRVAPEAQLPIDDLMLSVKNGRLRIRSKKYDKEVQPRLTNAHNYSSGQLPIYEFLAQMQTYNKRPGIYFDWGPLIDQYTYLPRVVYDTVILSAARWRFTAAALEPLYAHSTDDPQWEIAVDTFVKKHGLPQYVVLVEGDNELLIDMQCRTVVQMFLATVKNRKQCLLKEFLQAEGGIVKQGDASYTNQVIVSFYNEDMYKKLADG